VRVARRHAGWIALALVVAGATWLRLGLIAAGPDPDIDGYAHLQIAHRLAREWRDLRIHWVWLPLWQLVDFVIASLGGGLRAVRLFSVACAAASSFALALVVRDGLAARPATSPWLAEAETVMPFAAGAAHALWPQNLSAGASAEPEAFFQLLVLATLAAWQRRRYAGAAAALSLAALLRYEAWPLLPVFLAMSLREEKRAQSAAVWLAPGVAVAAWVALHRASTGEWCWFLRENRAYVAGVWREFGFATRPLEKLAHPWAWYPYTVPFLSVRAWLWLAVPGLPWFVVRAPRALAVVMGSLLALITLVWVARNNLGLERHFTVVIPAYATMLAAGVAAPVAALAWRLSRARADVTRAAVIVALVLAGAGFAKARTRKRAMLLRGHAEAAFVVERRVAAALRAHLGASARVFTSDATVEGLTDLDGSRFVRWRARDLRDAHLRAGDLVVAAPDDAAHLRAMEPVAREGALVVLRRR
jgi:hypothetical protein